MFRRLAVPTVVLAACFGWTRTASALDDAAPPWTGKRPFAVEFGNGFNAPLGVLSFAADFALFRYLSVAAGVGYGDGSAHFSTMARLRLPFGRTSVGAFVHNLGLGWSTGRHTTTLPAAPCEEQGLFDSNCPPTPQKIWDPAHRFDVEYSVELPLVASALVLRLYGGLSTIINSGNYACSYEYDAVGQCRGNDASVGNVFPYFGAGIAMLFGTSDRNNTSLSSPE